MKRKMLRVISMAIVMVLTVAMLSVSAFAYSDDYATINIPETFVPQEYANFEADGYVNIWYDEIMVVDGAEYLTYNSIDLYIQTPSFLTSENLEDYYNEETLEALEILVVDDITDSKYYYTEFGGEKAVALDVYYESQTTDNDGAITRTNCLLSEIVYVKDGYIVTADITVGSGAKDLVAERDKIANIIASSITVDAEKIDEISNDMDSILGLSIGIVIVVFIIILLIPVGIVVLIVVLVRSSKKKKAQQAQTQQYAPYGYNPYAQPQQPYNPNIPQQPYGNGQPQQPPMPSYMQPPVQPQQPTVPTEENVENNSENLDN